MAAPTASQLTPAHGSTDQDLGKCSVVWTPAPGETIDTGSFTCTKNGASRSVSFIHQGAGVILVESDVGLWPDESSVTVVFKASNTLAEEGTASATFSTRGGMGDGQRASVGVQSGAGSATAKLLLLSMIVEGDTARLSSYTYIVSGDHARLQLEPYEFTGAADTARLLASVTKPISDLLATCSFELGPTIRGESLHAHSVDGLMGGIPVLIAESVEGEGHNRAALAVLDPAIPAVDLAELMLEVGKEKEMRGTALLIVETTGGDSVEAEIELLSALLNDIRT
jgi:hypothetical protein